MHLPCGPLSVHIQCIKCQGIKSVNFNDDDNNHRINLERKIHIIATSCRIVYDVICFNFFDVFRPHSANPFPFIEIEYLLLVFI